MGVIYLISYQIPNFNNSNITVILTSIARSVQSEVSNRVLFGGWEIFFFYHHVRRRVRCGSFVCLSVFFFFVCPRNYLNNVQDIIKVHFCQLRLVVSFNNILYTHARIAQATHHATLGRGAMGTYGVHDAIALPSFPKLQMHFFLFPL